eukprot:5887567-Pleurochrysis_carterae.AAC.1
MSWIQEQAAKSQELLLDSVLRSGSIARRCWHLGKTRQKTFVWAISGVMNQRMDEDLFDSMS